VPGLGGDSAQQITAAVGHAADTFAKCSPPGLVRPGAEAGSEIQPPDLRKATATGVRSHQTVNAQQGPKEVLRDFMLCRCVPRLDIIKPSGRLPIGQCR